MDDMAATEGGVLTQQLADFLGIHEPSAPPHHGDCTSPVAAKDGNPTQEIISDCTFLSYEAFLL